MDRAKSRKNNHIRALMQQHTDIQKELVAKATIDHGNRKVERWRRKSGDISGFPGVCGRDHRSVLSSRISVWEGRKGGGEAADALLMLVWFQVLLPVGAPGGM